MQDIEVFTDGSSRGNPGCGGWGAVIFYDGKIVEIGGREDGVTNNRMELMAIMESLKSIIKIGATNRHILLNSDSNLAVKTFSEWVYKWEKLGWRKTDKKKIKNLELVKEIYSLVMEIESNSGKVEFKHVKAHIGITGNEKADEIATSFADNNPLELFSGDYDEYKSKYGDIFVK